MRRLPALLGSLLLCGLPLAHAHGPHILNYHTIGAGTLLTHSPTSDTLYAHVQDLLGHSYTFTTSRHFRAAVADNRSVALLTFDDGHESVLTHALPVLAAHGVTATAYIITDRIGRESHLTADDIKHLHANGWEIGSHTSTHAALPELTPASVRHELTHASTVLESLTGEPAACLAYPYGLHDALVREITREHHECAFTTSTAAAHHNHDPHGIPRPPLHRGDDAALSRGARGNPVASTVIGLAMLTWPLPDASPINPAPAAWTPTTYRSLGDGRYTISATLKGLRHELSIREGPWALHLLHGRGTARTHAIGLARNFGRFTAAGTYVASEGPGLGISFDWPTDRIRAETWLYWTVHGSAHTGIRLIPRDYAALTVTYHHAVRQATLDLTTPIRIAALSGEAHPLRLSVGYDGRPYAGLSFRVGSNTLALRAGTTGTATLNLDMRW